MFYYFDINDNSRYLYPIYVTPKNIKSILLSDPKSITNCPNISFNEKTQYFAIGTGSEANNGIYIYDLTTITEWKLVKILGGHKNKVTCVEINVKGNLIISYSGYESTPTIRCWDIADRSVKCIDKIQLERLQTPHSAISHVKYTKLSWIHHKLDGYVRKDNKHQICLRREDGFSMNLSVNLSSAIAIASIRIQIEQLVKRVGNNIVGPRDFARRAEAYELEKQIHEILEMNNIGIDEVFTKYNNINDVKVGDVIVYNDWICLVDGIYRYPTFLAFTTRCTAIEFNYNEIVALITNVMYYGLIYGGV